MRNIKFSTIGIFVILFSLFSCKHQDSIQQFIINQQENNDIISFDLPASSVFTVKEQELSKEEQETLKSIKKANILVLKINTSNKNRYLTDKQRIKNIFKQDGYNELLRFGKNSKGAKIYMTGDENSIDELLIFANDDTKGWILARILGDKMQPNKVIQLFKAIDFDPSNLDLSPLNRLLDDKDF